LIQILIDVGVALTMDAGHANTDHIIGAQHPPGCFGAGNGEEWKGSAGRGGLSEEAPARDLFHIGLDNFISLSIHRPKWRAEGGLWGRNGGLTVRSLSGLILLYEMSVDGR